MTEKQDCLMTRKDFIKISSAGLLGAGLIGKSSALLGKSLNNQVEKKPERRVLGRTGIKVTALGYGASHVTEPSLIKRALDLGINFIDTRGDYSRGQNEMMLGKVIKGARHKVIIQSKIRIRTKASGETLYTPEMRKRLRLKMEGSLNQSLKDLQTEYIDIMLLHGIKTLDIINHETVKEFLMEAKKSGKIRACGLSSHSNQVEVIRDANQNKFYDVIMVPYNHKGSYVHSRRGYYNEWDQAALEEEFKRAEKNGIGIVAMKTCSGGPFSLDGVSQPTFQNALKWVLSHSYIGTMAVAMGNFKQIKENIQVMF
jgi:aryl-alcohol dehydrogenase-like predicted oxidoreductase